jgi:hypothetical protein
MSELDRILAFVDGAKTGLDVMSSKQCGGGIEETEFWRGYRHALDCIGGHIDDIQSEAIEARFQ